MMKIHLEQSEDFVVDPSNCVLLLHQLVDNLGEDGLLSASGAPLSVPALAVAWHAVRVRVVGAAARRVGPCHFGTARHAEEPKAAKNRRFTYRYVPRFQIK